MNTTQIIVLCLCGAFFLIVALIAAIGDHYSLKGIPNNPVGNGQHGTACFATKGEVNRTYKQIPYTPKLWRNREQLPSVDGLIVGCVDRAGSMTALVDDADIHTLMIGAAGMSFVTIDSKGDLYRNTATIAEKYYGYKISVIDLRNPTRSSGYNMLYLVTKMRTCTRARGRQRHDREFIVQLSTVPYPSRRQYRKAHQCPRKSKIHLSFYIAIFRRSFRRRSQ